MNIFVSDLCPTASAIALDDKRVVKMVLESAQILSTIGHGPYKPTHRNHPCVKWAAASPSNALWLYRHFVALCDEYRHRFRRNHASVKVIPQYMVEVPFPSTFVVCPGAKATPNPTSDYRAILMSKWVLDKRTPKWTNRNPPEWSSHV